MAFIFYPSRVGLLLFFFYGHLNCRCLLICIDACCKTLIYSFTAIAAEQDALEEKNALHKIEQAKASAKESKEFAVQKRKRAQSLMENADLAIYKATMLVRIAEAAQAGESVDALAACFLD